MWVAECRTETKSLCASGALALLVSQESTYGEPNTKTVLVHVAHDVMANFLEVHCTTKFS